MFNYGNLFKISLFGESHGETIGVLIEGVKPGIKLSEEDFYSDLERRKPNQKGTTPRKESDEPMIKSGVFNGYTTGAPILIEFDNSNINDKDYSNLLDHPRPSHVDFTAKNKYKGFNDYRGGGFFSGRLTLGLVCAGVIAKKITGFKFESKIINLHGQTDETKFDEELLKAINLQDSIGGIIRTKWVNPIKNLGEPYFDSVESKISSLLFSVGGVKGVSFGEGLKAPLMYGSEFNDLIIDSNGKTKTNNNGGINGGITNGNEVFLDVLVRPTASIAKTQDTFNFKTNKIESLKIEGRHDKAIILRMPVVIEACMAIALCDLYLQNKAYE